jgi:hypothetical protein
MTRLSDCGYDAVAAITHAIEKKRLALPTEISLKLLEELIGHRVQSIGSAFDHYIKPNLLELGVDARKCGSPVVIQLKYTRPERRTK